MLSEAMNFNVLPEAGGLYDQHPDLLEQWTVIFQAKARYERKKQSEQQRKMKQPNVKGRR